MWKACGCGSDIIECDNMGVGVYAIFNSRL